MNNFNNIFSEFVNERFDDELNTLEKNNHLYRSSKISYNKLLTEFKSELNAEQIKKLDDIISLINTMSSQELTLVYKTAIKDIFNIIQRE